MSHDFAKHLIALDRGKCMMDGRPTNEKMKPTKRSKPQPQTPAAAPAESPQIMPVEICDMASLKPHPLNYRKHPPDQIEHLKQSIREHGLYRNVVVANDGTILAGHGVFESCTLLGIQQIPVIRLPVGPNDPRALKVVTGDNEIGLLADVDDRALSEILRQIKETDVTGLIGTGFDEKMLADLIFVTRPASEIADKNEAAEWAGMPAYEEGGTPIKLVISFLNEEDRRQFVEQAKVTIDKTAGQTWSTRWPFTERVDAAAVKFDAA